MAAIDFPNSPTVGQEFTVGDRTWTWTGSTWDAVPGTINVADITDLTATATEINFTDGVTSAIQTQINGKANSSHTHLLADITDVTATAIELNYVDGVTSAIQTQLNARVEEVNGAVTTAATNLTVVRNITLSTADPTGGMDGDVWLKYTD